MEAIKTFNYNDTQSIANAVEAGEKFYLKNGNSKSVVIPFVENEQVFPFSEAELDKYLLEAESSNKYLTKEESLARLNAIK